MIQEGDPCPKCGERLSVDSSLLYDARQFDRLYLRPPIVFVCRHAHTVRAARPVGWIPFGPRCPICLKLLPSKTQRKGYYHVACRPEARRLRPAERDARSRDTSMLAAEAMDVTTTNEPIVPRAWLDGWRALHAYSTD